MRVDGFQIKAGLLIRKYVSLKKFCERDKNNSE